MDYISVYKCFEDLGDMRFNLGRVKSSWMLHRVDCEKVTEDSWKVVLSSDGTSSPRTGSPL